MRKRTFEYNLIFWELILLLKKNYGFSAGFESIVGNACPGAPI
jgi:hypothetical protein